MSHPSGATSQDDARLIEAARHGSRQAFDELVRAYQDRLYSSIVHVVRCPDEAEEVVQETFIRAFFKLRTFQGRSGFFTWLFRIALNLVSSRRRRRHREVSLDEERTDADYRSMSSKDSPGESLLRKEQGSQVQAALYRLTVEHRQVLLLREFEGFDYETIARLLDTSIGTIRSRLHRARKAMRQEMNTYEQAQ